jgi:hypothetical protein
MSKIGGPYEQDIMQEFFEEKNRVPNRTRPPGTNLSISQAGVQGKTDS